MSKKSSRSSADDNDASSPTSPTLSSEDSDEVSPEADKLATKAADSAAASKLTGKAKAATGKAKDSASNVKDQADKAKDQASKAKDSASRAKDSASKAKEQAGKTKDSASKAKDQAGKAKDSASKAKESATKTAKGSAATKNRDSGPAKSTGPRGRASGGKSRSQRGGGSKRANAQVSRREQLRRQREAAERARKRRMRIVTGIGALVLAGVLFVVGFVLYRDWDNKRKEAAALRAVQVIPPNANDAHTGLKVGVPAADPNAPTLVIYEDYQCPSCKSAEDRFGDVIRALAASGKVNVEFRTLFFLDANLRNDSSVRSARAAACAATVGKYQEYHDVIYANQPETEGVGYTDEQLTGTFAEQAGITSNLLTEFRDCYDRKRTYQIVNDINAHASDVDKVSSTPTFTVNGKNPKWDYTNPETGATEQRAWWQTLEGTEEAWLAAITKVAEEPDTGQATPGS